ncbi:hypothetical protein DVH24_005089 [Malus domestica]|uniref:BZIP domain-containing protein n=1 Tax=Malus domestica TaxID=3750 RepID=A0A498IGC6_MALDO|nr:hypothetical protein DVH24_005089 [Malus domestica]
MGFLRGFNFGGGEENKGDQQLLETKLLASCARPTSTSSSFPMASSIQENSNQLEHQQQQHHQIQDQHHHHQQQQIQYGMMQSSSSNIPAGNFISNKDGEAAYDLGELDQALFLYLDGQSQDHHNPSVNHVHHQDQRHPHQNNSSSGMRPPTLNIFPSQPMHVEPSSTQREGNRKGPTTSSSEQEGPKTPDPKTLRRLAQNREAARKSRLRKKAYVQQLETSRIKLTQLEQELQRARSQGMFLGGGLVGGEQQNLPVGINNISSDAAVFDMEYARWLEEHHRLMCELRAAVQEHLPENELRLFVDNCLAHYDEVLNLKGMVAKTDVFHIVSGMWKSPAERCFMWMGGFRPSDVIKTRRNGMEWDWTGRDGTGRNGTEREQRCPQMEIRRKNETERVVPGGEAERKFIQNSSRGIACSTRFRRTKHETECIVRLRSIPSHIILNQIEPLTEQQLLGICGLQQSTQETEEALSQGLEALNQSLSETITSDSLSCPPNMANYMGHMAIAMNKLSTFESFVIQADNLRQQAIHRLQQILTTRQAARCLLAIAEYFHRLRALSSLWMARPRQDQGDIVILAANADQENSGKKKRKELIKKIVHLTTGIEDGLVVVYVLMSSCEVHTEEKPRVLKLGNSKRPGCHSVAAWMPCPPVDVCNMRQNDKRPTTTAVSQKPIWSIAEDVALLEGWVRVTHDPITENETTVQQMWKNIHTKFVEKIQGKTQMWFNLHNNNKAFIKTNVGML